MSLHDLTQDDRAAAAGREQDGLPVFQIGNHGTGQRLVAGGESSNKNNLSSGDSLLEIAGYFCNLSITGGSKTRQLEAAASFDGGDIFIAPAFLLAQSDLMTQKSQLSGSAATSAARPNDSDFPHDKTLPFFVC